MENLKAPMQEHHCKAIEHCESISIAKRDFDGKNRWMWEQTQKDGKITANEIMHCPYCGINLNSSTQDKPLTLEQIKKLKPGTPITIVCDDKLESIENFGIDFELNYWGDGDVIDGTVKVYARKPEGSESS